LTIRQVIERLQDLGNVITPRWVFRTTHNVDNLNSKSVGSGSIWRLMRWRASQTVRALVTASRSVRIV